MKKANVFLFGDINLDVSMPVPEIPPPGQDVYADNLYFNLGGSATNTAIALMQLGQIPSLLGSLGTDPNGDFLLKSLASLNIKTDYIRRKNECPSGQIFLPILPDGERTMYSFRGANSLTSPDDIPPVWAESTDLVHLSGYVFLKSPQLETGLSLIDTAHRKGIPISMDTGMDPVLHAHTKMKSILDKLSVCICGLREGQVLTGRDKPVDVIKDLVDLGIKCVAIKLGSEGCLVGLEDEIHRIPAVKVSVIDTTGSGDAFSAGILVGWLNHFALQDMSLLANALGAFIATQCGSTSRQLTWMTLISFMKQILSNQTQQVQLGLNNLLKILSKEIIPS